MTNILFVDCDGTIRKPKSKAKFIQSPDDQKIIKGADKAIDFWKEQGYAIVGITGDPYFSTLSTGDPLSCVKKLTIASKMG